MDFNESPVNYDFFGGQQQINDQHPGMLQSLPRQQSGISDMQLLQQQLMLKQMQEMQRQQQLQKQQEARKMNSINQPELMAANTTWQQRGLSPVMQGSFRGHVFSPEQGHGMPRLMGMVPQQVDQSLYGVPISAARVTQSQYSSVPMDKPSMQQILGSSNSLTSNQYTGFPEQVSMQDGPLVSRQGYQGKNMIASSDGQGINTGFNLESLQQMNPQKSNGPVQEICTRQDLAGPSETSQEDTALQVAPSQNVATLDPTEAQILFGPDDNLWDAFGRGANTGSGGYNMSDGTDLFSSLPSVQSGSWSALMQSAVAETSSGDTGLQEEWSCLNFRNSEPPAENQQTPSVIVSTKQQSNWADNCLQSSSSLKPRPSRLSHEINTGSSYNNIPGVQQSGVNTSHEHRERLQSVSPRRHIQQFPEDGHKWSDRSLMQKAAFEASPSQQLLIRERAFPSQSPSQVIGSLSSNQVISNTGEKGHTLLSRTSSVLSLPFSCDTSHGHLRNSISGNSVHAGSSAPGKFSAAFSPGFPYSKNHLPNLDMPDTGGQTTACESVNESFDRFSSQPKQTDESFERGQSNQSAQPSVPDTSRHTSHDDFSSSAEMPQPNNDNQNHARNFAQQFPVLEAAPAPQHCSSSHDSASSKIQPPVWTSVPKQLRPFGAQPFQTPSDMFKPNLQSHKCSGITFSQPQKLEDQTMQTGGNSQAESDECSMNSHGYVGKEQPAKEDHLQQVPPENNWAQKTKCASHENESAGMRNEEADHANRSLKRFKSPGGSVNAHLLATQGSQQIYEHNNMARDASANHTSFPPGDSKMLSLSEKTADNQDINAPSKDMLAFGRNDFQNFANSNSAVSVRDEHSQMSNQMGPSWPQNCLSSLEDLIHCMLIVRLSKEMLLAANQFGIFQKSSISSPIAYENFSQSLQPDSADGNVVVMRSKKRKSTISKLVPWHKEVTLGSQRPQNLSAAEVEWALAVNRLTEKFPRVQMYAFQQVEDELEMVDDGLPVHRSKRRLLLTTQLMQILLHPPLALILSADAILHYETAAYFVARSNTRRCMQHILLYWK
ncbi:hypothetical protein NC653_030043 [Populus alba x Populus x berolinensis]|uniref:Uncharacterized protein n=1 Tax=Populus alba x Populus x berolinensis TaxID=444605 RepID=A0AAD6M439_9ROSI|nr:hypothetical protein NC653_030043 [Populus alba x Populus x berolinensis]